MDYVTETRELLLMQQILEILLSISRKLKKRDTKNQRGLTASQYMIVLAIRLSSENGATVAGIANRLGTTKQNTSRMIPVLEQKGYISRAPGSGNKHASNLKLTDLGLDAMLEYAGTSAFSLTEIFKSFNEEELETLWHLLRKLHSYNGVAYVGFEAEAMELFERKYSGLMLKVLADYRKNRGL